MARPEEEPPPTAQPSNVPSTDPIRPGYEVLLPNLSNVSADTFRRGSISRHRVNIALGILGGVAIATILLVLFADLIVRNLGTILAWLLIVGVAVGMAGLVLLLRDEQRVRRAQRDPDSDPDPDPDR